MTADRVEVLAEGKFLRLVRKGRWEYAERTNSRGVVAIIVVTDDERLVLTEQYRPAVDAVVIDLPAGLSGDGAAGPDEPGVEAARRELLEETGYAARSLKHVADCPSSPGLSNEIVSYFLATRAQRVDRGGGVDGEQIEVSTPQISSIKGWLTRQRRAGKLIDPKVYVALAFATGIVR